MGEDQELIEQIEQLAHEEHALFDKESRGEASSRERARLKEIEAELEACYDRLRARRARRAAGLYPDVEPIVNRSSVEDQTG
jgi:hypothetical protein